MAEIATDDAGDERESAEHPSFPINVDAGSQELTFFGNSYTSNLNAKEDILPQLEDQLIATVDELEDGKEIVLVKISRMMKRDLPAFTDDPNERYRAEIDERIAKNVIDGLCYSEKLARHGIYIISPSFGNLNRLIKESEGEVTPEILELLEREAGFKKEEGYGEIKKVLSVDVREVPESVVFKGNEVFALPLVMTEDKKEGIGDVLAGMGKTRRALRKALRKFGRRG